MDTIIRRNFKVGDIVIPVAEKFHEIFKNGETAQELLNIIDGSHEIVDVKNYSCGCPQQNGGPHACILNALGCDQRIWLEIKGKKMSFAANLFAKTGCV